MQNSHPGFPINIPHHSSSPCHISVARWALEYGFTLLPSACCLPGLNPNYFLSSFLSRSSWFGPVRSKLDDSFSRHVVAFSATTEALNVMSAVVLGDSFCPKFLKKTKTPILG